MVRTAGYFHYLLLIHGEHSRSRNSISIFADSKLALQVLAPAKQSAGLSLVKLEKGIFQLLSDLLLDLPLLHLLFWLFLFLLFFLRESQSHTDLLLFSLGLPLLVTVDPVHRNLHFSLGIVLLPPSLRLVT